jgi:hypothetical protein
LKTDRWTARALACVVLAAALATACSSDDSSSAKASSSSSGTTVNGTNVSFTVPAGWVKQAQNNVPGQTDVGTFLKNGQEGFLSFGETDVPLPELGSQALFESKGATNISAPVNVTIGGEPGIEQSGDNTANGQETRTVITGVNHGGHGYSIIMTFKPSKADEYTSDLKSLLDSVKFTDAGGASSSSSTATSSTSHDSTSSDSTSSDSTSSESTATESTDTSS